MHASVHLDSFEQELNKLESTAHFQKYGVHYMSISYVIGIIFSLYMLFKIRKAFCRNDPGASHVRMYNQCNNKKIQKKPVVQCVVIQKSLNTSDSSSEPDEVEIKSTPTPIKSNIIMTIRKIHDF